MTVKRPIHPSVFKGKRLSMEKTDIGVMDVESLSLWDSLTKKQKDFCKEFLESGNVKRSYSSAYGGGVNGYMAIRGKAVQAFLRSFCSFGVEDLVKARRVLNDALEAYHVDGDGSGVVRPESEGGGFVPNHVVRLKAAETVFKVSGQFQAPGSDRGSEIHEYEVPVLRIPTADDGVFEEIKQ